MNRLFEYCTGKAAKAIQPCALMPTSQGYRRAKVLLKERFGDEFTITQAWVNMVTEGAPIKLSNGEGLQELADDLRGCVETLRAMNMISEIDSRVRILIIINSLPNYLQSRWRKEAVSNRDNNGRYPSIEYLVSFIEKTAREVNDPVFSFKAVNSSGQNYVSHDKIDNNQSKKRGASFNIQAGEKQENSSHANKSSCQYCGETHRLSTCDKWKNMPPRERFEVIKSNRLCFNCVDFSNHSSQWCRKQRDCNTGGCTR